MKAASKALMIIVIVVMTAISSVFILLAGSFLYSDIISESAKDTVTTGYITKVTGGTVVTVTLYSEDKDTGTTQGEAQLCQGYYKVNDKEYPILEWFDSPRYKEGSKLKVWYSKIDNSRYYIESPQGLSIANFVVIFILSGIGISIFVSALRIVHNIRYEVS